jgi:hypothetical protein
VPRLPPHTGLIGGIDGRNWSPVVSRNGVIEPHLVKTGAGKLGGVGRWVPAVKGVAAEPDEQLGHRGADPDIVAFALAVGGSR